MLSKFDSAYGYNIKFDEIQSNLNKQNSCFSVQIDQIASSFIKFNNFISNFYPNLSNFRSTLST